MKHFSLLTKLLYKKWYKWLLMPFPYIFYLGLFFATIFVQFYSYAMLAINGFNFEKLNSGTVIAIVTSVFVTLVWVITLLIASIKGRRKDLKYVIGIPGIVLFLTFSVYMAYYSLDFIVDFVAYLFMIVIPLICVFAIISLLIFKLTRVLFITVHASTQNFAEPIMTTDPAISQSEIDS